MDSGCGLGGLSENEMDLNIGGEVLMAVYFQERRLKRLVDYRLIEKGQPQGI